MLFQDIELAIPESEYSGNWILKWVGNFANLIDFLTNKSDCNENISFSGHTKEKIDLRQN